MLLLGSVLQCMAASSLYLCAHMPVCKCVCDRAAMIYVRRGTTTSSELHNVFFFLAPLQCVLHVLFALQTYQPKHIYVYGTSIIIGGSSIQNQKYKLHKISHRLLLVEGTVFSR